MSDLPFLTEEKDMAEDVAPEPEQVEAQPEPESKGEPEPAATPAAQPEEPKHIPLTALLDEREKRQKAEKERDDMARAMQAFRAAQQPQPDIATDPQAVLAQLEARVRQETIVQKVQTSRFLAEKEYGADLVKEAHAFFDENPHLSQALLNHPSPYHEAIAVYKRHKALQEIGPDPDAYEAKLREKLLAELQANLTPQPPKAPPPSMAASPATGGGKPPPTSGFSALFERE